MEPKIKNGALKNTLKNIEYLHIVKSGKTLLQFGEEINGKTKTDLQKLIGNALGEGSKRYVVKYFNDPKITVGVIRAFSDAQGAVKEGTDPNVLAEVNSRIRAMQEAINAKTNTPDISQLLIIKDSAYQIQIDFYKQRITQLENQIEKYEKQLSEDGGGGSNMLDQLLPLLLQAFAKKPA